MPKIDVTDEELDAMIRYFNSSDIVSYMAGTSKHIKVSMEMSNQIKDKLVATRDGVPVLKKGNARIDAIWSTITGTAGRSNT